MTSARLGGASGPVLTLIDNDEAATGRAWMGELTECVVEPDEGSTTITSDYDGDTDEPWFLRGSALQSVAPDSLWRFTWDHSGETFRFRLEPYRDPESVSFIPPNVFGYVTIGPRPRIGGAAKDKVFNFEFDWRLTEAPQLDQQTPEDGSEALA